MKMQDVTKHSFWITTGLVIFVFLTGWYLSTNQLKSEAEISRSKIQDGYSSVTSVVSSEKAHPNDYSREMTQQLIDDLKDNLLAAWKLQYDRQKDILVWPEELDKEFLADIDRLLGDPSHRHPIEAVTSNQRLEQPFLEQYRDFPVTQLPPMADIIQSNWEGGKAADDTGNGGAGGIPGFSEAGPSQTQSQSLGPPPIVNWAKANQDSILSRFTWGRAPTTMEVLYAQEDLWVMREIMLVLQEVNKDAEVPSKAIITELITLEVGRQAQGIRKVGQLTTFAGLKTGATGTGDGMGGMDDEDLGMEAGMEAGMGDSGSDSDSSGEESTDGTGTGASSTTSNDPSHHRYVDNHFKGLDADRLKSALQAGATTDLQSVYLAVAKRYPIRLRLKMNLTKLPELLTVCGNAKYPRSAKYPDGKPKLPIEILQISVNGSAGRGGATGGGGNAGSMEEDMFNSGESFDEGDDTGLEGMDMFGGSAGQTAEQLTLTNFPYDEEIELYGIVYIYNPVNIEKLGITPEAEDAKNGPQAAEENKAAP